MLTREFEALGTKWCITIWDSSDGARLLHTAEEMVHTFDDLYSRFRPQSFVWAIAETVGVVEVPRDLTRMLTLYKELNALTDGKINPAIGYTISDLGYDESYSLVEKDSVRKTPLFGEAVRIIDENHIELKKPTLLDLGALGKGYLVDVVYEFLRAHGVNRFFVDGSGDIRYYSHDKKPIIAGLEHPYDATRVIGTVTLTSGALSGSSTEKRRWGSHHHYIDPHSLVSPDNITATWARADTCALADGIASALFFVNPKRLSVYEFSYIRIGKNNSIYQSDNFCADLFIL